MIAKVEASIVSEPTEPQLRPNERPIRWDQLSDLVARNKGTYILNPERMRGIFGTNGEGFNPRRAVIAGAWVQTGAGKKEWLFLDGHHTAQGQTDPVYQATIREQHPGHAPTILDATEDSFRNAEIVRDRRAFVPYTTPFEQQDLVIEAAMDEGPSALTLEEYLMALVPATKAQEHIAPLRATAHIMQFWDKLVGSEEVAKKYSALAAFAFLDSKPWEDKKPLDERLTGTNVFFAGDSASDRAQIRTAIRRMASVLEGVDVYPGIALKAAFTIACKKPEAAGGRDQAKEQLAGLLYEPTILSKLQAAYPTDEELAKGIHSFATILSTSLGNHQIDTPVRDKKIDTIFNALKDQRLTADKTKTVLADKEPEEAYMKAVKEFQAKELGAALLTTIGNEKLTGTEELLVARTVAPAYYGDMRLQHYVNEIIRINDIFVQANALIDELRKSVTVYAGDKSDAINSLIAAKSKVTSTKGSLTNISFVSAAISEIRANIGVHHRETDPELQRRNILLSGLGMIEKAELETTVDDLMPEDLDRLVKARRIIDVFIAQHQATYGPPLGEQEE